MKTVGATDLGGLWALEWAWHAAETNLRCVRSLGICMPNPSSSHSFRDLSVHPDRQTDGKTDMARSTRLVILIKNIWGRKPFLLPVTYFPTNDGYKVLLNLNVFQKCPRKDFWALKKWQLHVSYLVGYRVRLNDLTPLKFYHRTFTKIFFIDLRNFWKI